MALVLVVDDEMEPLAFWAQVLPLYGHSAVTAQSAAQALAAFSEHESLVALVVSDVSMPGTNGFEFFCQMRARGYVGPWIFCSGESNNEARARALGAYFFPKPCDFGEILEVVQRLLPIALYASTNR